MYNFRHHNFIFRRHKLGRKIIWAIRAFTYFYSRSAQLSESFLKLEKYWTVTDLWRLFWRKKNKFYKRFKRVKKWRCRVFSRPAKICSGECKCVLKLKNIHLVYRIFAFWQTPIHACYIIKPVGWCDSASDHNILLLSALKGTVIVFFSSERKSIMKKCFNWNALLWLSSHFNEVEENIEYNLRDFVFKK